MKIPKSIKLPRKLKKELKKGVEIKVKKYPIIKMDGSTVSLFNTPIYVGSGTKPFNGLCKCLRREERRKIEPIFLEQAERLGIQITR